MRKLAIILIFGILTFFGVSVANAHEGLMGYTADTLEAYCTGCDDENFINTEAEIKEHFKEELLPVSLDECIGTALLNNFNIKVANAEYVSAKWMYRNALSQFLPDISFEGYTIYYKGQVLVGEVVPVHVKELALSGTLNITHDLTKGGEQIFEAKARKLTARANLKNLDYTKDEVILKTASAYYELLRAKIRIEIQLKNLYERTVQLKLTETQKEAGFGTRFDVVRSKSEQALAEQDLMEALINFRNAQAALANIMGIEVKTALLPVELEVKPLKLIDESLTTEDLFKIAEFSRDDVKKLENEIKSLKQEKNMVYTEFVPKPKIIYQGQFQGTARVGVYNNNVVGAYYDIPIGSRLGVGTITKAKSIQAQIDGRKYSLEQLLRNIKENIISNFYNAEVLKERIEIAKRQVEYASDSVKLAELRLDAGEGILIDVIQAQTIKNNARIELLSTIVDYNINQVRLLFDNGTISYDNIVKNYNP